MWQTKIFKTQDSMQQWINKNGNKMQYSIIYVNNAYGIEYKPLRVVY